MHLINDSTQIYFGRPLPLHNMLKISKMKFKRSQKTAQSNQVSMNPSTKCCKVGATDAQ